MPTAMLGGDYALAGRGTHNDAPWCEDWVVAAAAQGKAAVPVLHRGVWTVD